MEKRRSNILILLPNPANKSIKSTNSFAMLRHVLFLFSLAVATANGNEKCQEDAECSLGTFCSNGFCEGDCVKCQLFRRQESANGCVKEIRNCGPCLSGMEAEDLVGGGKSIYCKPIGILTTPAIDTSAISSLPFLLAAAVVVLIAAVVVGAILRRNIEQRGTFTIGWIRGWIGDFCRQNSTRIASHLRSVNAEEDLGQTSNGNPPPFNQNFNLATRFPEAINDGESDDSTGPSPSNRLLPPQETENNNANPGIYQDVEIDLSQFRRNESSIGIESSPGAQSFPISVDSDNEDEGNVDFSIAVNFVGPSNDSSKNP